MKRIRWKYNEEERALINAKYAKNRLYFALQLKYYETHLEFFTIKNQISHKAAANVAKHLGLSVDFTATEKRIYTAYRKEIREYCDSRSINKADENRIKKWLTEDVFPHETLTIEQLKEKTISFLKGQKIEAYSELSVDRVIRSIKHRHEEALFNNIAKHIDAETKAYLNGLLITDNNASRFSKIKRWPGGLSLKTILSEAEKLKFIQSLSLPECIKGFPDKTLMKHYRNICTKYPSAIKAMPEKRRYAFLAVFIVMRERQITDNLVELLIRLIKKFIKAGKNKLQRELSKVGLDEKTLKTRLLLAILGYGTNTGLKSMSAGNEDVMYQDLQHIKLRYFDPDNLRMAIRSVINQLFKIRMPEIWKQCTTAVASDSTHVKATDQNLMSQFHPRYRSSGVMIYWHVDTKSVCIYSQLKSCSSSEVSSMIEGVLRHCTDMKVEKNYVDTHGASEVGFAFSYLLDFDLLPRFKNIHTQKLYTTHKNDARR